jgi:hypothetical protein
VTPAHLAGGAAGSRRVTAATAGVTSASFAGEKVIVTVQRKSGASGRKVTSLRATFGASGAYSWKYKPAKKGSYRIRVAMAKRRPPTRRLRPPGRPSR